MRGWQGGNRSISDLRRLSKLDAGQNVAAVVTVPAVIDRIGVVHTVSWSYNANPAPGKLTITCAGQVTYEVDITTGGPGILDVDYVGAPNKDIVITLAGGGGTTIGKVNVKYSYEM